MRWSIAMSTPFDCIIHELLGIAYGELHRLAEPEEHVQEVMLRFFTYANRPDVQVDNPYALVGMIAVNVRRDWLRRKYRRPMPKPLQEDLPQRERNCHEDGVVISDLIAMLRERVPEQYLPLFDAVINQEISIAQAFGQGSAPRRLCAQLTIFLREQDIELPCRKRPARTDAGCSASGSPAV
jgi:hypothetical protein